MRVGKKLRIKRLQKLAAHLATLPPEIQFEMCTWGSHDGDHRPSKDNYCGTSACALGHAAMIPAFKREGLKLDWAKEEHNWDNEVSWDATVRFGRHINQDAGQKFFGLTPEEASALFLDTNADRADTIAKIIRLCEGQEIVNSCAL